MAVAIVDQEAKTGRHGDTAKAIAAEVLASVCPEVSIVRQLKVPRGAEQYSAAGPSLGIGPVSITTAKHLLQIPKCSSVQYTGSWTMPLWVDSHEPIFCQPLAGDANRGPKT